MFETYKKLDQSFKRWMLQRKLFPQIAAALPEAIDLMALIMKAGLDFQVALKYYIDWGPKGPLHDELEKVQTEMQFGSSRVQALRNLIKRTPEPSLCETASTVIQGIELGSSLSGLLRAQSQSLRRSRAYEAERKAAQAPLKLMFPLFVFIFPTIFVVLFGPILITMFQGGSLQ